MSRRYVRRKQYPFFQIAPTKRQHWFVVVAVGISLAGAITFRALGSTGVKNGIAIAILAIALLWAIFSIVRYGGGAPQR